MKYFKITNQNNIDDIFYTSSTSDATTVEAIVNVLALPDGCLVEECTQEEFERETEESEEETEEGLDPKADALKMLDEIRDTLADLIDNTEDEDISAELALLSHQLCSLNSRIEAI